MTNSRYVLIMLLIIGTLVLIIESRCDRMVSEPEVVVAAQPLATSLYPVVPQFPRVVEKFDFPFAGDSQIAKRLALVDAAKRIFKMAQPGKSFQAKAELCLGENKFCVTIYEVR